MKFHTYISTGWGNGYTLSEVTNHCEKNLSGYVYNVCVKKLKNNYDTDTTNINIGAPETVYLQVHG